MERTGRERRTLRLRPLNGVRATPRQAATEAATEATKDAVKEATDIIESAADSIAEASTNFEESTKRIVTSMERDIQDAAQNAVERAVRGIRDDLREALNVNLDEYKEQLHEASDQGMNLMRAEMKAIVTDQVDHGVESIAARVEGLVIRMEKAAAALGVAAKKAAAARDEDSRDNSPSFIKASFEPTLPRVGVIADELKNEEERAEEIHRSRERDYIACAPKLPSILDDLQVIRAK